MQIASRSRPGDTPDLIQTTSKVLKAYLLIRLLVTLVGESDLALGNSLEQSATSAKFGLPAVDRLAKPTGGGRDSL
jgi:hypothetical protein